MARSLFIGCLAVLLSGPLAVPLRAQTEEIQDRLEQALLVNRADAPGQPPEGGVIPLQLTPTRLPTPVLRHALLPELRDQTPGDGGPLFLKAAEMTDRTPAEQSQRRRVHDWIDQWTQTPLEPLPVAEARTVLKRYQEVLALLEKASCCENHTSDLASRVRKGGTSVPVPELSQLRTAGLVLCLQARLELAEGSPDRALRTLRTCFRLGQYTGESASIVSAFVGIAIATRACGVLEEVICHPRTPNLSWSLASLPRPLLSLRTPLEGIRLAVHGSLPGALAFSDREAGPMTEAQVQALVRGLVTVEFRPDNLLTRYRLVKDVQGKHEAAKKALVVAGWSRQKVETWPHLQVAAWHSLLEFDQLLDEVARWQSLPFWEAKGLERFDDQKLGREKRGPDAPAVSLVRLILPSLHRMFVVRARLERQLAALRCLEVLRLHAARHDGKLPARLDEITAVPLPVCPITGKPFAYRREGDKAILSAPPTPGLVQAAGIQPLSYRITIKH